MRKLTQKLGELMKLCPEILDCLAMNAQSQSPIIKESDWKGGGGSVTEALEQHYWALYKI